MPKLNQIIAIHKGVKARVYGDVTTLHKETQKAEPFNGFVKSYRKRDEEGEDYPAERKKVQLVAADVLKTVARLTSELFDIEATQDWGNTIAKADIIVDGVVLVKEAPATFMLFLEKQLTDIRTIVEKLPTLDEGEEWTVDPNSTLCRSAMITTHRTKKVQRAIVKYDAVIKDGHALPAQTEMITEDVVVGYWDTVKHSGAIPLPRKQGILDRVDKLLKAVKFAREAVNSTDVEMIKVGEEIFGFLFI